MKTRYLIPLAAAFLGAAHGLSYGASADEPSSDVDITTVRAIGFSHACAEIADRIGAPKLVEMHRADFNDLAATSTGTNIVLGVGYGTAALDILIHSEGVEKEVYFLICTAGPEENA